MKPNVDVTDYARSDDFTALVLRVAEEEFAEADLLCVRLIAPPFTDDDGTHYPASVVYHCRRTAHPMRVSFDSNIARMVDVEDVIAAELEVLYP